MSVRTILIQSYARKNKNHRKKYFILSICTNYTDPRLDYFISKEKWSQKKHELDSERSESLSYQSIDLSNLFHVDDILQSKFKLLGLNLYMENRHLSLIVLTEDLRKKWKECFENIIYKNKKLNPHYNSVNIEHVLEVSIRLKPKENIDKSVYAQLRGSFRACFTKSLLLFVNNSLENPALTIQYPFIRQWESRYDGTFRLEIGRAALIGECILILQLADYEDSKAAHAKLTNCINSFKSIKPEPPKIRSQCEKPSKRSSLISCSSKPISLMNNSEMVQKRHDSCITFGTEPILDNRMTSSKLDFSTTSNPSCSTEDTNYLPMNGYTDSSPIKPTNALDYVEHTNRIYKCPNCGCLTKLVIYCSRCCDIVNVNTLSLLCKPDQNSDPNSLEIQCELTEPTRNKAQSLTEKPIRFSSSGTYRKPIFLDISKQAVSNNSKSSSKTSTTEASLSSKQESQNSLAISANRHDDDIFMELDFDNLDSRVLSSMKMPLTSRQSSQLKCANCSISLIHKAPGDNISNRRCSNCYEDLVTLSIPIKDSIIGSYWRPRTTSLVPPIRPRHPINTIVTSTNAGSERKSNHQHHHNTEYVDVS